MNLIIQSIDDGSGGTRIPDPISYLAWMAKVMPIHAQYAAKCGAAYELFIGSIEPGLNISWNRIELMRRAFDAGYSKVVWLDADTLVVNLELDIFDAHDGITPVRWVQVRHGGGVAQNDGVIVANNCVSTVNMLDYVWSMRHEQPGGHEQGWLDEYAMQRPDVVAPLDPRFNWYDWQGGLRNLDPSYPPESSAVILAWHTVTHRLAYMHEAFARRYPRH